MQQPVATNEYAPHAPTTDEPPQAPARETPAARVVKGALAGGIAGMAGAAAMAMTVKGLARFGPDGAKEEARSMQEGMDATRINLADRVSERARGEPVPGEVEKPVSMGVHLATGMLGGAAYGAAAEASDRVTMGQGLGFGTAFWLASRNVALPSLNLAPPVTQSSVKSEAETLALHLLYGVVTESVREPVRRAMS